MKRQDLIVMLIFALAFPLTSLASSLSLGDAFSTGETITAAKFNNKFNALNSWAAGGVGSDNITNGTIQDVDIQSNTITGAKIFDGTIGVADIGTDGVDSDEIKADAVGASEIAALSIPTGDIALNAASQIFEDEEGTWAAGICTGGTATPTSNPGVNTALRVTTTVATTDERLNARLWVNLLCTSNCNNSAVISVTCNYDTTEDDSHSFTVTNIQDIAFSISYINLYTPVTGGAKDLDCYIWRSGGTSVSNYCARLVVEQVKR